MSPADWDNIQNKHIPGPIEQSERAAREAFLTESSKIYGRFLLEHKSGTAPHLTMAKKSIHYTESEGHLRLPTSVFGSAESHFFNDNKTHKKSHSAAR